MRFSIFVLMFSKTDHGATGPRKIKRSPTTRTSAKTPSSNTSSFRRTSFSSGKNGTKKTMRQAIEPTRESQGKGKDEAGGSPAAALAKAGLFFFAANEFRLDELRHPHRLPVLVDDRMARETFGQALAGLHVHDLVIEI